MIARRTPSDRPSGLVDGDTAVAADTAGDAEVPRDRTAPLLDRGRDMAQSAFDVIDGWSARVTVRLELLRLRMLPTSRRWRAEQDATSLDDVAFLRRPAILGFVALMMVAIGASLPSSPFKLELPGAWFFGMPRTSGGSSEGLVLGLVAVYGGLVLFMRVWYRLTRALAARPGVPVKYLVAVLALWVVPMLVVPPLFSQDVYSYAAQGEMVSHHISPYVYGPYVLGASPYLGPVPSHGFVNSLWGNTPAPYGPIFMILDGAFASLSFHNMLGTVVLLRILALVGVALIAWAVPQLARQHGKDPSEIFVLGVLNPLVLLSLVASAHNDALMLGVMLCGIAMAKRGRPIVGILLCSVAAAIKIPAELAVLYIGWEWMGTSIPLRHRIRPVVTALLISGAVMIVFTAISGLGFGWIANLETPGTVRSWLAPATGIGMLLTTIAHVVHIGISQAAFLSVTRVIGLLIAAATGVYLLLNTERFGALRALGFTLLLFVLLGPVVQPWYLSWGLLTLAVIATGWTRRLIVTLSVVSPFIGLPGARLLLTQLIHSDPLVVAGALILLLGVLLAPLGPWARVPSTEAVDEIDQGGTGPEFSPRSPLASL